MKFLSIKLTVLALAGLLAASSGAQATGLYDTDNPFPNFPSRVDNDDDYEEYCEEHPYVRDCRDYREERREYRHYRKRHHTRKKVNHRCAALIRAVGKRNVVKLFARNSARFAWRREARAVHGSRYSNWHNARNAHINCSRTGILFSCTAKATPCKY